MVRISENTPGDNAAPLSVSEISGALKRVVEDRFGYVRIKGEISGYKRAASGHVYLTLKDDKSVLDGVMWKGNAGRLPFQPEDGIEVVVSGKLTTLAGRSKYQVVIDQMELAGEGALMALFEKLKSKLSIEGLFDQDRKQDIPFLPKTIGVVTSPTGSVIRDILHRLADRCPSHVIVWPVLVQGDGASKQIANAINGFSEMVEKGPMQRPDLLIVARGGGSIEDLWSFNEEEVVRAVADCSIPIISAVGQKLIQHCVTMLLICAHLHPQRRPKWRFRCALNGWQRLRNRKPVCSALSGAHCRRLRNGWKRSTG